VKLSEREEKELAAIGEVMDRAGWTFMRPQKPGYTPSRMTALERVQMLVDEFDKLAGRSEPLFYVQDTRGTVGNSVSWWAPDGKGYTTHIDRAGKYTENDRSWRDTDKLWPVAEVDKLWSRHVDQQDLDRLSEWKDKP
jgi:hypothetical protein